VSTKITFNQKKKFYLLENNMFSRLTLLFQQLPILNSRQNLSFKQLNEIKPIIRRNLTRFFGQSVKQTFGL
jgi:hypothetical protein